MKQKLTSDTWVFYRDSFHCARKTLKTQMDQKPTATASGLPTREL